MRLAVNRLKNVKVMPSGQDTSITIISFDRVSILVKEL